MDRRSLAKLKLDRRLTRRTGWVSKEELERELEALPDVSDKIARDEDSDAEGSGTAPEPPSAE